MSQCPHERNAEYKLLFVYKKTSHGTLKNDLNKWAFGVVCVCIYLVVLVVWPHGLSLNHHCVLTLNLKTDTYLKHLYTLSLLVFKANLVEWTSGAEQSVWPAACKREPCDLCDATSTTWLVQDEFLLVCLQRWTINIYRIFNLHQTFTSYKKVRCLF